MLGPKWDVYIRLLPSTSRLLIEEGAEISQKPEMMHDLKEPRFSGYTRAITNMNSL